MCINQACVSIGSLNVKQCPDDCNNHGICDNMGNCHCQKGFQAPFCDSPGPGGSILSGPASDPNR